MMYHTQDRTVGVLGTTMTTYHLKCPCDMEG